jgi:hypothetical protein
MLGMLLPGNHLSTEDKDVVRLGTGLIGTIAALVLGLLIASGKTSYDTQSTNIRQMTANIIVLDNLLAQYGPEASANRNLLRDGIVLLVDRMWRENSSDSAKTAPFAASDASQAFYAKLQQLSPQNDAQRSLQSRAIQISTDLAQTRLLLFAQAGKSVPNALPHSADFLARHDLCKLRTVRPAQRNRYWFPVDLCSVGCRSDLPDPGSGPAIFGANGDL